MTPMPTPINICVTNVQAGVGTTKGAWQYAPTMWKYWLPHSDRPLMQTGQMMKRERVDLGFLVEVSGPSLQTGFRSQTDLVADSAELEHRHFFTEKDPFRLTQEGLGIISRFRLSEPKLHRLRRGIQSWFLAESTLEIEAKKITLFLAHPWKPRHAFDRILLSEEFDVLGWHIPHSEIVSDHLPLIARVELK